MDSARSGLPALHPVTPRRSPGLILAVVLAVVLAPYLLLVRHFDFLNDDAFISFRYARHFAEGHGLRFNLGSDPPVEGFSNFLWVLWLGGLGKLGIDIPANSRFSAIACGIALVVWFVLFLRRRFDLKPLHLALAGLVLSTLPQMTLWSTSGLAAMPTALFVFVCFERLLGDPDRPRPWQAGLFGALAALTRADGVGYVGLIGIAGLFKATQTKDRALLRACLIVAVSVAMAVLSLTAWRLSYFGELVPNTAELKGGFSPTRLERGWNYVVLNLLTTPTLAFLALAGLLCARSRSRGVPLSALILVAGTFGYGVYVGGDFLPFGRLLVPAVPFAALLLVPFWESWVPDSLQRAISAVALIGLSLLSSFGISVVPRTVLERFAFRYSESNFETELENFTKVKRFTSWWTELGRGLQKHTRPGESIILYNVGVVGYYCDLVIYDMYGLTHREAAKAASIIPKATPGHDMSVPWDFFFSYQPTYVSAVIVPKGKEMDMSILAERSSFFESVVVERHELFEAEGFTPNTDLLLGRIVP